MIIHNDDSARHAVSATTTCSDGYTSSIQFNFSPTTSSRKQRKKHTTPEHIRCQRCGNSPARRAKYYPFFCRGCGEKYAQMEKRQKSERLQFATLYFAKHKGDVK